MKLWEKVIVNIEQGTQKLTAGAAVFSERIRAEVAIVRLRVRRDEIRSLLREQYEIIGRKLVDLAKQEKLPKTTDVLLHQEEIATALSEIEAREKDLEDVQTEIANEHASFTIQENKEGDTM